MMVVSEFVYWIALTDGCIEDILREHMRAEDTCKGCGKNWPCNMRKRAVEALDLLNGPLLGRRQTPTDLGRVTW